MRYNLVSPFFFARGKVVERKKENYTTVYQGGEKRKDFKQKKGKRKYCFWMKKLMSIGHR